MKKITIPAETEWLSIDEITTLLAECTDSDLKNTDDADVIATIFKADYKKHHRNNLSKALLSSEIVASDSTNNLLPKDCIVKRPKPDYGVGLVIVEFEKYLTKRHIVLELNTDSIIANEPNPDEQWTKEELLELFHKSNKIGSKGSVKKSQRDLAKEYGISPTRIGQLLKKAEILFNEDNPKPLNSIFRIKGQSVTDGKRSK